MPVVTIITYTYQILIMSWCCINFSYRFIHLFIKLREGPPPEHYYTPELNGYELKEQYLSRLRNRKIVNSL